MILPPNLRLPQHYTFAPFSSTSAFPSFQPPTPLRDFFSPNHTHTCSSPLGLALNARTRLLPTTSRLGTIAFIGPVPSLPGPTGLPWVGIILDEPQGKNDGSSPDGTRYFTCEPNRGVFVRPDRCEVGEWGVRELDEDEDDELNAEEEI